MIRKTFILIFIVSIINILPQGLPDYNERGFAILPDSMDAFTTGDLVLSATDGSVDPEEYMVGPGDKMFISINGIEDINLTLLINQEGILFIPKVGGVDLNRKSLKQAKDIIEKKIDQYYRNVDIFISLVDFRKIKVSLLGDVKKPSSFTLKANARLIDLIYQSKGLTNTSNYRNITIKDRFGNTKEYDFLSFLRFGDRSHNPLLQEGDAVIVDKVDKVVYINGLIKYPGTYEYVDGETAAELIKLAGGFTAKAKTDTIEIVSFTSDGKSQYSNFYPFNIIMNDSIILENQDHILVRERAEYLDNKYVNIQGYVKYPGWYNIIEDETMLSDIIEEAGGFREDASLTEATVHRQLGTVETDPEYERLKLIPRADMTEDEYDYFKARSRQMRGKVVVDFVELFRHNDMSEDIILKDGDRIKIPESKNYVILIGQVVKPGNIIYDPSYSIEDYIELAGGFAWRAEDGDVRVVRADSGEWIEADEIDQIYPGDTIWVPEDPPGPKFWDVFTTSLTIVGQVASIVAAMVAVIVATGN